jgi:hypothetical protein
MTKAIKIFYRASDGFSMTKTFKLLSEARRFAHQRVGKTPEIGRGYAVSADGVGTIYVSGATLADVFPSETVTPTDAEMFALIDADRRADHEYEMKMRAQADDDWMPW